MSPFFWLPLSTSTTTSLSKNDFPRRTLNTSSREWDTRYPGTGPPDPGGPHPLFTPAPLLSSQGWGCPLRGWLPTGRALGKLRVRSGAAQCLYQLLLFPQGKLWLQARLQVLLLVTSLWAPGLAAQTPSLPAWASEEPGSRTSAMSSEPSMAKRPQLPFRESPIARQPRTELARSVWPRRDPWRSRTRGCRPVPGEVPGRAWGEGRRLP